MNGLDNITLLSSHRFLLTLLNYTRGYKFSLTKWEFLGFRNWPWLISSYINLFLFAVSYLHEKKFNRLVYDYFYTLSQSTVLSLFLRNSCYSEWHEINKYNYEFLEL